jgi:hypothetical protein
MSQQQEIMQDLVSVSTYLDMMVNPVILLLFADFVM